MKFTLGERIASERKRNHITVMFEVMHGDADMYEWHSLISLPAARELTTNRTGDNLTLSDQDRLRRAVELMQAIRNLTESDWNNAAERYPTLPDWFEFFDGKVSWPHHNEMLGDGPCQFNDFKLIYTDDVGADHMVNFTMEENDAG